MEAFGRRGACARFRGRATRRDASCNRSLGPATEHFPLQLDRVPTRPFDGEVFPSESTSVGVSDFGAPASWDVPTPRRPVGAAGWFAGFALLLMLLGVGEPRTADPRFRSPSVTLDTYWQALRHDDDFTAAECMLEPSADLPEPGMLWFLPPTTSLRIANLRVLPVESGRVMATYELRFVPLGGGGEQVFRTAAELERVRGEWRIGHPIGEVSMPEWRAIPRAVDL